jgi:outer membrane protein OmpA-like peptidoglycan-associated protein
MPRQFRRSLFRNPLCQLLVVSGLFATVSVPARAQDPTPKEMLDALRPSTVKTCPDGRLDCRGIHINQPMSSTAPKPTMRAESVHYGEPASAPTPGRLSLNVVFANGSAQLTPEAMHLLNNLGSALNDSRIATDRFRIEGHTDTVGSPDVNRALSDARARAVVHYLVNQFNIDPHRLEPIGMGPDGLLIPTKPDTPEPRNRRVQVVDLGQS